MRLRGVSKGADHSGKITISRPINSQPAAIRLHEYDGRNGTSDTTDLTARQLAVFLKAYLEPETEHTVRGLTADLNVSKPAITRALDRLANSDLIRREKDEHDRRSVIVRRTSAGSAYLRTLSGYVNDANKLAAKQTVI
jgi:DNA-binding MarR family transcriptional regulator